MYYVRISINIIPMTDIMLVIVMKLQSKTCVSCHRSQQLTCAAAAPAPVA